MDETYKEYCQKNNFALPKEYIQGYTDGQFGISEALAFKPNKLGLHDIGGNLWQWCDDWYDAAKTQKLLRGGCWADSSKARLLSSARWPNAPGYQETKTDSTGFRCVIEVPQP